MAGIVADGARSGTAALTCIFEQAAVEQVRYLMRESKGLFKLYQVHSRSSRVLLGAIQSRSQLDTPFQHADRRWDRHGHCAFPAVTGTSVTQAAEPPAVGVLTHS